MRLHDAIQTYHDLLTDEVARECQAALEDQSRRRGLFFGTRPLCTVLRPRFVTTDQYRFLQDRSRVLLRAFERAYRAALADRTFRAQFGLFDWEEDLVQHDPGFRAPSPTSRLDAFFDPEAGTLRYSEYNAETPAAAAYSDMLAEIFLTMPVMRDFLRHYELRPLPARHGVLHALLDAYQQWAGRRALPRIAILARGPHLQRVRPLPALFQRARPGLRHRRPAGGGIPAGPPLGGGRAGGSHL